MKNIKLGFRQRGALHATAAAMITIIAMVAGIASVQLSLTSNAKITLDYAALMAARAGAVSHADSGDMMLGFLRGLAPLYGSSSAPTGGGEPAEGVDWLVPDPANVDQFNETLMGADTNFARDYEEAVDRTVRGDASADRAFVAAAFDLVIRNRMAGIAITNPVSEAFSDFGEMNDGFLEIPNKGIWRRTGNKNNASTNIVQVCETVTQPFFEDPTTPPAFDEPSASIVRTIFDGFTWDVATLKEEENTDCGDRGALDGCRGFSAGSGRAQYIEEVSGKYGEQLGSDINGIIDQYYNAEIDAPTMYRKIRERAEQFKADFQAAGIESVDYCDLEGAIFCYRTVSWSPESKDWGPMDRVDELIETARILENGTGRSPARSSLSMDAFESAIGDARERNQRNGEPVSAWDAFVASELDPLWETWVEDTPTPMYKEFLSRAALAAKNYENSEDWTTTQKRYLKYLQAVAGNVDDPDKSYDKSENCESKEVAGYVAPTVGTQSNLNIQDANLLRVYVLYGHEPFFDLPEAFYNAMGWSSGLTPEGRAAVPSSLRGVYDNIVNAGRIPLISTSVVRMQSEARQNDLMLSTSDPFFIWDNLGVE